MKHRILIGTVLAIAVGLTLPMATRADPQRDLPVFVTQPDGRRIELRVTGDEFHQVTETVDGYTVTLNRDDGWICYAALFPDRSRLVPTPHRVGVADPAALGLARNLRISKEARRAKIESARQSLRGDAPTAKADVTPDPIVGTRVGITILVDFDDDPGTIAPTEVDDYLNLAGYTGYGNNGSVRDYFFDVSGGLLTYTNQTTAYYYRAENLKTWYENADTPAGERARILVLEALNDLDARGFDFGTCDADGDGYIDAINIFYAGFRAPTWAAGLWPHSGGLAFTADGLSSRRYQITDLGDELTLRTFVHENGHMVCLLPDLYDYGYESKGAGDFCLMAYGPSRQNPARLSAPMRRYVGWTTDIALVDDVPGLPVTAESSEVYLYPHPDPANTTEYYLIENRQQSGRDANLPDSGLAIWHVDETGSNNHEQMTAAEHYEVTLVQADGFWDLEHGLNEGDATDLWAAPYLPECTPFTDPATTWWNTPGGNLSGLALVNISATGPVMTFDFEAIDWTGDCNQNGVPDDEDIGLGTSPDVNGSGVPDECEFMIGDIQAYQSGTGWPSSPYLNRSLPVFGVVYSETGVLSEDGVRIADGTGGIEYVAPFATGLSLGDTVMVRATVVADLDVAIHLADPSETPSVVIVGHGPEPQPRLLTLAELTGSFDHVGDFVEVEALLIYADAGQLILEQDGSVLQALITDASGIDTSGLVAGNAMRLRGSCTMGVAVVRMYPRFQADLAEPRTPAPQIVSVRDVADDQGLQVEVSWIRSLHDAEGDATPVLEYEVRRDAESVLTVPVTGAGTYTAVVATLADSTGSGAPYLASFVVRGGTGDPGVYYDSGAAEGYSVDNIEPATPTGFTAAYAHDGVALDWDDAPDPDVLAYRIYRGTEAGFVPGGGNLVGETLVSSWSEAPADPWDQFYKVAVLDDGGNESPAVAPGAVTGTGDPVVPLRTALLGAVPNPFNPLTRILYETATAGTVQLKIFDPAGRLVATLVDRHEEAGRHAVVWDGRDRAGRAVAAGVYLYRMEFGGYGEAKRVLLIK